MQALLAVGAADRRSPVLGGACLSAHGDRLRSPERELPQMKEWVEQKWPVFVALDQAMEKRSRLLLNDTLFHDKADFLEGLEINSGSSEVAIRSAAIQAGSLRVSGRRNFAAFDVSIWSVGIWQAGVGVSINDAERHFAARFSRNVEDYIRAGGLLHADPVDANATAVRRCIARLGRKAHFVCAGVTDRRPDPLYGLPRAFNLCRRAGNGYCCVARAGSRV
jgi:hypothetical protein